VDLFGANIIHNRIFPNMASRLGQLKKEVMKNKTTRVYKTEA